MKERFESLLKECPVIAILRGITPEETADVCQILYEKGIRIMEIPLNSPRPFESIRIASERFSDRMAVGAGTVLTAEEASSVRKAGGSFCVSPNSDGEVIAQVKASGMLSIPGFFTATEGFAAVKAGADYLKLFPAAPGVSYIRDLKAVIKAPIFAVGGVHAGNMAGFLDVCAGVGIGSALYKAGKSLDEIAADTAKMISEIRRD